MRPGTSRRRGGRRETGAALLIVMVAVALVTAVAVDLAYQTRVNIQIAANGRDELRAQAQARGSVALGRLVLHFQTKLDEAAGRGQALAGALVPGAQAQAAAIPRPQLWKLNPVDSLLVANLFGGGDGGAGGEERRPSGAASPGGKAGGKAGGAPAGDPARPEGPGPGGGGQDGHFQALIDDEDQKVSVQLDAPNSGGLLGAQFAAYMALVEDRRWDFLFDHEDANGQRTSRTDLAVHLVDWTDLDQVQSSVTGNPAKPFEAGFGDENFAYDRGPYRYKAKNARFDSLDELYLVTGVSDALMAAFGEHFTVYLSKNAQMNVNASDQQKLLRNAAIMADPPLQPLLLDPTFGERLQKAVRARTVGSPARLYVRDQFALEPA